MFFIKITGPRQISGAVPQVEAQVQALPREGDAITHDKSGISGTVRSVSFWWPEDDAPPVITVRVRQ